MGTHGELGSVLGDWAAEVLEGDGFGFGAAALLGVQGVDGRQLVGGELEVEDVDVLRDPVRLGRLRDDRAALLQVPAQHHLGGGLAVCLGDLLDDRVVEQEGCVGRNLHVALDEALRPER